MSYKGFDSLENSVIAERTSLHPLMKIGFKASRILALTLAFAFLVPPARAQFFVGFVGGSIGTYDATSGAAINPSFITEFASTPTSIVLRGNTLYVADNSLGAVRTYDATTGAVVNPSFITGGALSFIPYRLEISGNTLFVSAILGTDPANYTVGTYNATTGAALNASFITGPQGPLTSFDDLAISGTTLYVAHFDNNAVGTFDATTGAALNTSFITGPIMPAALAISGNTLFVSDVLTGTVGTYDATTGAVLDASFITGVEEPYDLVVFGNDLLVMSSSHNGVSSTGSVGRYDATTGATIDAGFIGGLDFPISFAVPEPASALLLLGSGAVLLLRRRRAPARVRAGTV
jgi:hypothetical protein